MGPITRQGRLTALAAAAVALALPGSATAAVGDLTYRDCISGESESALCAPAAGAVVGGTGSGYDSIQRVRVSRDGTSVYAISSTDDSIVHLRRDRATGALTQAGCQTGDTAVTACAPLPVAGVGGNNGFDHPEDLAVSPDGRSVYVITADDDSLVRFARDPATGAVAFASCISGESVSSPCAQLPSSTPTGADSGLEGPEGLVISPDNRFVYVLTSGDDGVAAFELDPAGALAFRGCVTGASSLAACSALPSATPTGSLSGFASVRAIAITRDGSSVYTVDDSDEAIGHFNRDGSTGALTFVECLTAETAVAGCAPVPGATPNGTGTGLRSLVHVATSPDLSSVYAAGDSEDTLVHYARDPASGRLSLASCHTNATSPTLCTPVPDAGPDSGMNFAAWVEVAPDARTVYVGGVSDTAITRFDRNPVSGLVTHAGCVSAETETAPRCGQLPGASAGGADTGLDGLRGLASSPDARSLYTASVPDDAIARFDREPDSTGPQITLEGKKRQRPVAAARAKRGKVTVTATCADEFCSSLGVGAELRAKVKRKRKRAQYKAVSATEVQAGQPVQFVLKPKRKAKKLLKKSRRAKVTVTALAADLLGNQSGATAKVKIRR